MWPITQDPSNAPQRQGKTEFLIDIQLFFPLVWDLPPSRPSLELQSAAVITWLFANPPLPNGPELALDWSHWMDLAWVRSAVQIDRSLFNYRRPTLCKLGPAAPSRSVLSHKSAPGWHERSHKMARFSVCVCVCLNCPHVASFPLFPPPNLDLMLMYLVVLMNHTQQRLWKESSAFSQHRCVKINPSLKL